MRFLLVLFLTVSSILSAQGEAEELLDVRYIWAKSGLTLRAEGKTGADKIGVVPYGATVRLTGEEGDYVEVTALEALTISPDLKSKAWAMSAHYLEIEWEGKTGWVYGGYLVRFPVPAEGRQAFEEWLEVIGGVPDTVLRYTRLPDLAGYQSVYRYDNGITRTEATGESWGSTTVVIPLIGMSHGFLIADRFYWMARSLEAYRSGEITDMEPAVLSKTDWNFLQFTDEFSSLEIRLVGGVLIITSEGGC
jgi:hypothetical protein